MESKQGGSPVFLYHTKPALSTLFLLGKGTPPRRPYTTKTTTNIVSSTSYYRAYDLLWRSEIRSGRFLAILALFGGYLTRVVKVPSDTVRWRGSAALMLETPSAGLQSLLYVNRFVHTLWWNTWKVTALHRNGGDTPKCDGRLLAPHAGYLLFCSAQTCWLDARSLRS